MGLAGQCSGGDQQRDRESGVRPSSGWTASLVLLAGLTACGGDRKPVDETQTVEPVGWGCLARLGELADDPLNPLEAPFCRIGLLNSLKLAGKPVATVAVIDRGAECTSTAKGFAIDLAPGVAARFHEAFLLEPDFVPMDRSPACPPLDGSVAAVALPGGAQTALEFTAPAILATPTAAGGTILLPTAVTATLIEAGSGRVLWRERCATDTAELTAAAGFPELANLRQVLSDEALRCARGFAATLGAPAPL